MTRRSCFWTRAMRRRGVVTAVSAHHAGGKRRNHHAANEGVLRGLRRSHGRDLPHDGSPCSFKTMRATSVRGDDLSGIYVVGGRLRATLRDTRPRKEHFGRRIRRSPLYRRLPGHRAGHRGRSRGRLFFGGAALPATSAYSASWDGGRRVTFDPIIEPNASVGTKVSRSYRAAHNLGWVQVRRVRRFGRRGRTPWRDRAAW